MRYLSWAGLLSQDRIFTTTCYRDGLASQRIKAQLMSQSTWIPVIMFGESCVQEQKIQEQSGVYNISRTFHGRCGGGGGGCVKSAQYLVVLTYRVYMMLCPNLMSIALDGRICDLPLGTWEGTPAQPIRVWLSRVYESGPIILPCTLYGNGWPSASKPLVMGPL